MESCDNPRRWRDTATVLLGVVLAVAVISVVFDGGRSAFAADDCQYGQYGQYDQYDQYGPYGGPCPKAEPTLTLSRPQSIGIGIGVQPRADLGNGDGPTGPLTFRLYRPGDSGCATPTWEVVVAVNGNGSYSPTPIPFLNEFGVWRWTVAYGGDARNEPVATGCDQYPTTVTMRTPVFLQLVRPQSVTVGGFVTLLGNVVLYQPSEPVSLYGFPPSDPTCSGSPAISRQVPAPVFSETVGPLDAAGTWRFVLSYPGDAFNTPGASACSRFPLEVTKAAASLVPFTTPPNATIGGQVTAGASVFGSSPTGTLTLRLFAPTDPSCSTAVQTRTVPVSGSGPYGLTFTPTTVGTWRMAGSYSGDAANTDASLACDAHRIDVAKAAPTLDLVAIPLSAKQNDTLTARVELEGGYLPTGRVQFRLFGPADTACAGSPAYVEEAPIVAGGAETAEGFQVPKGAAGTWNWTAGYSGDGNNVGATSACGTAQVTVVDPGADPQDSVVRFASNTSTQVYDGFPASFDGGPPPTLLGSAQRVCLSAAGCPPGATDWGSPFGGAWTSNLSSIPGAAWIWRPGVTGATPNADHDQAVFSTTVVLAGRPSDAWIAIAADDIAEVHVNGELVGTIGGSSPAYGFLTRFDLRPFVKPGANTIAILARNGPWCGTCSFSSNPAGLVFGGVITVE